MKKNKKYFSWASISLELVSNQVPGKAVPLLEHVRKNKTMVIIYLLEFIDDGNILGFVKEIIHLINNSASSLPIGFFSFLFLLVKAKKELLKRKAQPSAASRPCLVKSWLNRKRTSFVLLLLLLKKTHNQKTVDSCYPFRSTRQFFITLTYTFICHRPDCWVIVTHWDVQVMAEIFYLQVIMCPPHHYALLFFT